MDEDGVVSSTDLNQYTCCKDLSELRTRHSTAHSQCLSEVDIILVTTR